MMLAEDFLQQDQNIPPTAMLSPSSSKIVAATESEDARRLAELGYKQEVKRIFGAFTNFGESVHRYNT